MSDVVAATIAERGKIYGDPRASHTNIGLSWTALIQQHYDIRLDHPLPPELVAQMMVAFKMQRAARVFHADNYVDAHAYVRFCRRVPNTTTKMTPGHTLQVLDHGFVRYIDHHGSDQRIVEAARISFRSPSKGEEADKKLIHYLYKNRHTSPFEMVKVTLNIKMPIFVMRQYVRHRMQNLNEVSARYTELPEEFYIPQTWRVQSGHNKQGSEGASYSPKRDESLNRWNEVNFNITTEASRRAYEVYQMLLSRGVAREMARMVLPVNIYTEIYACWDLKNLLHFITLREDAHAQAEIQDYGRAIKSILVELFPWTMEAYEKFKFQLVEL